MKTVTYTYDIQSEAECLKMKKYLIDPAQAAYDVAEHFILESDEIRRIKAGGIIHETVNTTPTRIISLLGIKL